MPYRYMCKDTFILQYSQIVEHFLLAQPQIWDLCKVKIKINTREIRFYFALS